MKKYTLEEARKIVMKCAKQYEKNLMNSRFEIIYRDRVDNKIKDIEVCFGKENYQHLTGVELMDKNGNIRKHTSELFFEKCLRNRLAKNEIKFKVDGTTHLKLAALPVIMSIHKVTKITGDYNNVKPYLIADKLVGNIHFCLGLKRNLKNGYYVPVSSLLHNIKDVTDIQSQVLAIFSKEENEVKYENVRHVAKGINLYNIKLPEEIENKISLEKYEPKC